MPHPGEITKFVWFIPIHHDATTFPFEIIQSPFALSSYKLRDIHESCEIEAKVQMPQPYKHGHQISHPHEYYDNQIPSTTERKSV